MTAKYFEAPSLYGQSQPGAKIFLAGGITGCPDWQAQAYTHIEDLSYGDWKQISVFNPRRKEFPMDNPNSGEQQIKWEHKYLNDADCILFWFPASTSMQPIALFELGAHLYKKSRIVIGIDDDYLRNLDVRVQAELAGHYGLIHSDLHEACVAAVTLALEGWKIRTL